MRFEILRDAGNAVAETWRLRYQLPDYLLETYRAIGIDLEASNGEPSGTLPLPARYIVDTNRVIRYARVNGDYRFRPNPSETLDALDALAD